jgi:hypothetical protein
MKKKLANPILDQNVRLHQRLVDILARLTTRLEEEMEERFRSLNQMFQEVETATASLKPQMNDLRNGFTELDKFFREEIVRRVQVYSLSTNTRSESLTT